MAFVLTAPQFPPGLVAGQWQDGICDCTNGQDGMLVCCQTICCDICTITNLYQKTETGNPEYNCGTCCVIWCCSGCSYYPCWTNSGLAVYFPIGLRRQLMQRYGVMGESFCKSCLLGTCCHPCNTCQMQREMASHVEFVGGVCISKTGGASSATVTTGTVVGGNEPHHQIQEQPYGHQQQHCGQPHQQPPYGQQPGLAGAPVAQPGMVSGVPMQQPLPRLFQSGLCDCNGCGECCEALCCDVCMIGYMGSKLDVIRGAPGAVEGKMDIPSCIGACCCGMCLMSYMVRREVIERYRIQNESAVKSFCCMMCCHPCFIAQTRREMGYCGEYPGGVIVKEAPPFPGPQA